MRNDEHQQDSGSYGSSVFDHYEKQFGKPFADEMRSGCRTWLILFAVAVTVIAIAVWSIMKQIQ